jgi:type IX secretion system PorP/SprF family membrane protein
MEKCVKYLLSLVVVLLSINGKAQDPHFSQFFAAPLNINPAFAGDINGTNRLVVNYRQQWSGLTTPYKTQVVTWDTKLSLNKQSPNYFGAGIMLMGDQAMDGVFKSNYASANLAGHFFLDEAESNRLSIAFAGMYGNRIIDYSQLNFASQFVSGGFNTSLPTGEKGFANMKPFGSVSAGLLYQYASEKSLMEFGVAAYHLNRPMQSSFSDPMQRLPVRFVFSGSLDQQINDNVVLNVNGIYHNQASGSYFAVGGALCYYLNEDEGTSINGGLFYRSGDAIYPYVGLGIKQFQFGFTYDITTSQLKTAPQAMKSWELSLTMRLSRNDDAPVKCPKSFWR